jgi:hypothetical protein
MYQMKAAKTQAYQLVGGESYVHGLIQGEGLAITEKQNLPMQDFLLGIAAFGTSNSYFYLDQNIS